MEPLLLLFATPIITLVMHLGPGLLIVRRLALNPVEKLVAAVALSGIAMYLVGFFGYLIHQPKAASALMLISSLVSLVICRKTIRAMLRHHHARRILIAWAALLVWLLLLMSLIRSYNGSYWYGDWFEHYERTEMFARVNGIDVNHGFLNDFYKLPARPPFQNAVAALATSLAGTRFDSFAFAMSVLNGLIALSGMLLLTTVSPRGRRAIYVYAALLALSPMYVQNATFSWTKLYAGFYALTGLYFYLRAFNQPRSLYLVLSALCFAAGTLVHYSIVPYVIVLAPPMIWRIARRPRSYLKPAALGLLSAILLICTWVAFSIYHFGLSGTVSSNTSVTDAARLTFKANTIKILRNLWETFVPMWAVDSRLAQEGIGYWRDRFFVLYQTRLPTMFGLAGICILATSRFWRNAKPSTAFWLYYITAISILGVVVHGGASMFGGLAHVGLTPLVVHGIAVVAVALQRVRDRFWLRLIALGYAFDAILGILVHWFLQSRTIPLSISGEIAKWQPDSSMTMTAYSNLILKENWQLVFPYDHWPTLRWPLMCVVALTLGWLVQYVGRVRRTG